MVRHFRALAGLYAVHRWYTAGPGLMGIRTGYDEWVLHGIWHASLPTPQSPQSHKGRYDMTHDEQPQSLKDDPITFLAEQAARIDLLEKQVAALMHIHDAKLPPGVQHAWPKASPSDLTKGAGT
jgi:hypothetical protein